MHKLNLDFTELNKPKAQKQVEKVNRWASPIGWWDVSTEGDDEGRTSQGLGVHYGHVAEIAFHLANRASWKLTFRTSEKPVDQEQNRPLYMATKRHVHISFIDGDSPFFLDKLKHNEKTLLNWLDAEGVKVSESNLYGAAVLTI